MELEDKVWEKKRIPGYHGKHCPANGLNPEVECGCEECDDYMTCFPDWKDEEFFDRFQA